MLSPVAAGVQPSVIRLPWPAAMLAVAAGALLACGRSPAADAARDCDVGTPPVLTDSGVGALRIGTTVEEVARRCQILSDTTLSLGNEGLPERRLTVVLGSIATTATVVNGRVWRIEIASPRFRTADSLGVGSRMKDLRATTARVSTGEYGAYVRRGDHCGLSFQLPRSLPTPDLRAAAIPDTMPVHLVLVIGCD